VTLLAVDDLVAAHGLLVAVRGVSLSVSAGERVAIVGANGAGKTTLLRTIAGAHPLRSGSITLDGENITHLPAYKRVGAGIAMVPEGRKLFADMTVRENLLLAGRHSRPGTWNLDTVLDAFALLRPLLGKAASTLSGGEQQATAIGRALMTNPRVLLMDEVSLGLAPVAVAAVYESMASLIASGTAIILVEQDLSRAMSVVDRVICMLEGAVVLEGSAADLTREQVTEAYFGLKTFRETSRDKTEHR
jgi:branched-chain amino acid transport system ATP-binding protein